MTKSIATDTSGRIISIGIVYKTDYGTKFKVDGDLIRTLEVEGSTDYVRNWIREKLRKMENGQIKVVKGSSEARDWEQEEKIKKQLREDISVNAIPQGRDFEEIICTKPEQTASCVEYRRPPSPDCKIL